MIRGLVAILALACTSLHAEESPLWSRQFTWTRDHLPLVTVSISQGRDEITLRGVSAPVRLLSEGPGGPEVNGGTRWRIRLEKPAQPARLRWHIVVASFSSSERTHLDRELQRWRSRDLRPQTFEIGTLFGVSGQVVDDRRLLVTVAPAEDEAAARHQAQALAARFRVHTSLHREIVEPPHGLLVAEDEHFTRVHGDSVLWFAPQEGLLAVEPVDPPSGTGAARGLYSGQIYLTIDALGRLTAVNVVPEDRLLGGLLPSEMGAAAPQEALKAQAVAARTELFAKLGTRHLDAPFRLCSTVHCQVYGGASKEDPRTAAAVTATRGELLARRDGHLVDAVYSASCGGHTEDNDRAWATDPDPALRGVADDHCAKSDWSRRLEGSALAQASHLGALKSFEVLERGVSQRVVRLRLTGTEGTIEAHSELAVRRLLGDLPSALFTFSLERSPDGTLRTLQLTGKGHGHGVGLCQSGAMGMAAEGQGYREILQHYYRGTTIRKLY